MTASQIMFHANKILNILGYGHYRGYGHYIFIFNCLYQQKTWTRYGCVCAMIWQTTPVISSICSVWLLDSVCLLYVGYGHYRIFRTILGHWLHGNFSVLTNATFIPLALINVSVTSALQKSSLFTFKRQNTYSL